MVKAATKLNDVWIVPQQEPFLRTKLCVPPRSHGNVIARARLLKRLDDGLTCPLTLVSAPAGYGKTTLIIEWMAASTGRRFAWLTLDEGDNDPERFWTYCIAALDSLLPSNDRLQFSPRLVAAFTEDELAATIEQISASIEGNFFLVLEDYHLITASQVHVGLTFLLSHLPGNMHVVILSRTDPPLPLAQLRGRGQLTELRAADLSFTAAECRAFLNQRMQLNLSEEDVNALATRTEGWIAGLHLAALSLQGRSDPHEFVAAFTGRHHQVLEYLTDEVLARQPEAIQHFLLKTSLLDRFCGPMCEAVLQDEGGTDRAPSSSSVTSSQATLDALEHANLFLAPLDDEHYWYRYHPLFRDLLRHHLVQRFSKEQIDTLHRQASAWLEENATIAEAMQHALAAHDAQRAAQLAEKAVQSSALDSRMTLLLEWVEEIPDQVMRLHPRLQIYQAWALFMNGYLKQSQQKFNESKHALEDLPPTPENIRLLEELEELLALMGRLAIAFRSIFGGDLQPAIQECTQVQAQAQEAGNLTLVAIAMEGLAQANYQQGRLRQATQLCQEVIDLCKQGKTPVSLGADAYIHLAGTDLERNDLPSVERHLKTGMRLCQALKSSPALVDGFLLQSRLRQAQGDIKGAQKAFLEAEQVCASTPEPIANFNLMVQNVRLNLSMAHFHEARRLLQAQTEALSAQKNGLRLPIVLDQTYQTLSVRVCLANGEPQAALTILDRLSSQVEASGRLGRLIEIDVLKALALRLQGKTKASLAALERSLKRGESEGYTRIYLDEGAPMIALLQEALQDGLAIEHIRRILSELKSGQAPKVTPASPAVSPLIDPLTPAEIKILTLLAAGCSNQEICTRLAIALNTVKRHTHSIYNKLNVKSRTQAVLRARQLGLIP